MTQTADQGYQEMRSLREALEVLDMWYGTRKAWRDESLPIEMDAGMCNPDYVEFSERSWHVDFPPRIIRPSNDDDWSDR